MNLCPKCHTPFNNGDTECQGCGIIFEKYARLQNKRKAVTNSNLCKQCEKPLPPGVAVCPSCNRTDSGESGTLGVKEADNNENPPKKGPSFIAVLGGGILALCLFLMFFGDNLGSSSASKDTDLSNEAFIQCKNFVSENLKSPSSADFPFMDFKAWRFDNSTYVIKSYVDAQNSFGAQIRSNWHCKIQYQDGEKSDQTNWKLLELEIL